MTTNKLIKALQRLKVETGSIACLGCGHEHNCGIHGCAIIREAAEKLDDFNAVFNEARRLEEKPWVDQSNTAARERYVRQSARFAKAGKRHMR